MLSLGCWASSARAQTGSYINQQELETILNRHTDNLDALPEVFYDYHVLEAPRNNSVIARNTFYKILGEGNMEVGQERARLVGLLNRVLLQEVAIGDTLVVPTVFELDLRAYSPFPRYYPGARDFDKLFIIDKSVQAWVAYEHGEQVRWGIVNTGGAASRTPNGRFNFNWKEEYRVSTLSPADEPWEMYWVFNFHEPRGIHIHQYPMPTGGPDSHGCVRLVDADARWIYTWADTWQTTVKGTGYATRAGRILKPGTTVLVIGDDPSGDPHPFEFKKRYPVLKKVGLPAHPYDLPPGTPQQEFFDKQRLSASR